MADTYERFKAYESLHEISVTLDGKNFFGVNSMITYMTEHSISRDRPEIYWIPFSEITGDSYIDLMHLMTATNTLWRPAYRDKILPGMLVVSLRGDLELNSTGSEGWLRLYGDGTSEHRRRTVIEVFNKEEERHRTTNGYSTLDTTSSSNISFTSNTLSDRMAQISLFSLSSDRQRYALPSGPIKWVRSRLGLPMRSMQSSTENVRHKLPGLVDDGSRSFIGSVASFPWEAEQATAPSEPSQAVLEALSLLPERHDMH